MSPVPLQLCVFDHVLPTLRFFAVATSHTAQA